MNIMKKNQLSKGSAISFCPTTGMSRSKTYEDRKDKLIKRKEQFTKLTIISRRSFVYFLFSKYLQLRDIDYNRY